MEHIYYLLPSDPAHYRQMLNEVAPKLDDAGISFHICRPGEDIAGTILQKEVKE